MSILPTTEERFWAKVDKNGPNGCWVWTGAKTGAGYGEFWPGGEYGRRMAYSHRFVFGLTGNTIPLGLQIDHLCRNPACCNPAHLEAVTQKENLNRGDCGKNMRDKTHCPHGHPYDETNTRFYQGRRFCRACGSTAERAKRKREAVAA